MVLSWGDPCPLLGKRFLSTTSQQGLELGDIANWPWESGIIRAASHKEISEPGLQLQVLQRRRRNRAIPADLHNNLMWDPDLDDDDESQQNIEPFVRRGQTSWCLCQNCQAMPTEEECLCCHEIENIVYLFANALTCICSVPHMRDNIVSRDYLYALYRHSCRYLKKDWLPIDELEESEFRKTSYREFTLWIHGHLGAGNRRPIPSCAVTFIRQHFPAPDQTYLGFIPVENEPNAVYMID